MCPRVKLLFSRLTLFEMSRQGLFLKGDDDNTDPGFGATLRVQFRCSPLEVVG